MAENLPPTVCLNAKAVRRIREEKKLTQLYVAKVVGVTTDTISRWENNRYPSMKRANALRLAEALEVPLENVLQQEEGGAQIIARPCFFARVPKPLIVFFIFLLVLLSSAFIYHHQMILKTGVFASRSLPPFGAPGAILPVRIHLLTEKENNGFILRENFPPGWKLIESFPPPASLDNEKGTARWMGKPGESHFLITYLLKVAPDESIDHIAHFRGSVVAAPDVRKSPQNVTGEKSIKVQPYLWADVNADNQIDDKEMLQASKAAEEMQNVHLEWDLLEDIWDAGSYSYDSVTQNFIPQRR
jgi:transcriptional regulator with XRE-family HTH domain